MLNIHVIVLTTLRSLQPKCNTWMVTWKPLAFYLCVTYRRMHAHVTKWIQTIVTNTISKCKIFYLLRSKPPHSVKRCLCSQLLHLIKETLVVRMTILSIILSAVVDTTNEFLPSVIALTLLIFGLRPQTQPIYSFHFGVLIWPLFLWCFLISFLYSIIMHCIVNVENHQY